MDNVEDVNEETIRAKEMLTQVMCQLNIGSNDSSNLPNLNNSKATAALKLNEIQNILEECRGKLQSFPSMTACNNVEKELQKNLYTSLILKIHDLLDSVETLKPIVIHANKRNDSENDGSSNYVGDSMLKDNFSVKTFEPRKQGYCVALQQDSFCEDIQDVKKLVQSAQELNTLFSKMSTGVALQGTLMDRIDYLVDEGAANAARGKDELIKFEKNRYMKRASRLILTLSVVDIVLAGLVLLKIRKRFA
ncbi:syntaxin-16-like isoform X2 [Hylaeus volcanicus]|uniref:syntaxin-16-like isoform X2 n=1 Tax=Hylaeus volcanicus TaxID=313075 RepID=UPI0023B86786|nr:syntaxin-16-like isoform X2 [Hylaeus volcanicus]